MDLYKRLANIQHHLKAPKGQYNNFGKYKYRSCEDILESVKPLLMENGCVLHLSDHLEMVGERYYIKAVATLADCETGESVTYGLYSAQERGTLFIGPGEKVYAGMVIGQNGKAEDIELNVCKTKHLTNTRSSSADEALRLTPPKILSLEQALDFIDTDELLEVTPKSLRIRKKILDSRMRKRSAMKN